MKFQLYPPCHWPEKYEVATVAELIAHPALAKFRKDKPPYYQFNGFFWSMVEPELQLVAAVEPSELPIPHFLMVSSVNHGDVTFNVVAYVDTILPELPRFDSSMALSTAK